MKTHSVVAVALLCLCFSVVSCDPPAKAIPVTSIPKQDWELRQIDLTPRDSLLTGSTYLSSYSEIYVKSQHSKMKLTGTISMRNINPKDSIFIEKAIYHKTDGTNIRSYFDKPVFLAPLETLEIIIGANDLEGGTGDNFVFEWRKPKGTHDPFFEGVFITDYGQQGISFTTRGIRIE
ncbi:DUF3124 domain-containing protein [Neolewinella persica]|uniref:DUF3124 domain-containing protein n=1 Tax=Neolewinella persica TaxID=70998 RepID=UPI000378BDC8|nr:DUF3124 domain-containing protein [Neolewinella persica]